jgi:molybdopterin synthase sulfur carrier subunit
MRIEIKLFGSYRQFQEQASLALEVADGATVGAVRQALAAHAAAHWPTFPKDLLKATALASDEAVLLDSERAPHSLAVLPPVSGG